MSETDSDDQFLSSLSPRIKTTKKIKSRGPRLSTLKKHFRKSLLCDQSKATVPNDNLTIIEISSTDSDFSDKLNGNNFNGVRTCISVSDKSHETSRSPIDDIISPSPTKKIVNLQCLSTSKKSFSSNSRVNADTAKTRLFEIEKWVEDVNRSWEKLQKNSEELSLISYEDFKQRAENEKNYLNSTFMPNFQAGKSEQKQSETSIMTEDEDHSGNICDDSREKLLDDIYGTTWRKNKIHILPKSEKKPKLNRMKNLNIFNSERKLKKPGVFNYISSSGGKQTTDLYFPLTTQNIYSEKVQNDEEPGKGSSKSNCSENTYDIGTNKYGDKNAGTKQDVLLINGVQNLSLTDREYSSHQETPFEERIRNKLKNKDKTQQKDSSKKDLLVDRKKEDSNENARKNKHFKRIYFIDASDKSSEDTELENENKLIGQVKPITNSNTCLKHTETDRKKTRKKIVNYRSNYSSSEDSNYNLKNSEESCSNKNTLTFLASLSKDVPDHKCNLEARKFKNNYNQLKENLAVKLFKLYNEKVFNNLIPEDTGLQWNNRMLSTAGFCSSRKVTHRDGVVERKANITLSSKVLSSPDRLRDTLIHEMCHAATWIVDHVTDGHGNHWKAWANKATKAFPELPPIKTCHNYVINTKYTYRCTSCGYSIRRHRKSLDIERKRCGYCLGKFEVLINKTNKKGEQKLVPSTPKREPTGFALFVKENYSNYKKPELKHADVMRLLSEKFNQLKV